MHFPIDTTKHITTAFDEPVVDQWLEGKITQTTNVSATQDRSAMQGDPNRYSRVLYRLCYVPPQGNGTGRRTTTTAAPLALTNN